MLSGSAGKQVAKLPDAHVFSMSISVGKEVGIDFSGKHLLLDPVGALTVGETLKYG